MQDRDEFVEAAFANLKTILILIYALFVLAVVIALLGIADTLALSISSAREVGGLRAVGMSRAQLRAMVGWEATIIALLGTRWAPRDRFRRPAREVSQRPASAGRCGASGWSTRWAA